MLLYATVRYCMPLGYCDSSQESSRAGVHSLLGSARLPECKPHLTSHLDHRVDKGRCLPPLPSSGNMIIACIQYSWHIFLAGVTLLKYFIRSVILRIPVSYPGDPIAKPLTRKGRIYGLQWNILMLP